jgi:hypothetical protein
MLSDMYAKVLQPSTDTSYIVSRLFYEKHILSALDDTMLDVWGTHNFFVEIELGTRIVIGLFDKENDNFLGCIHGTLVDGCFTAHLMLRRKVDAVKAAELCTLLMKQCCQETEINFTKVRGFVPDTNRAIKRMAVKSGYTDCGIAVGEFFIRDGKNIPIRIYEKEI